MPITEKPKFIGMEIKALSNLIKRRLDSDPLMNDPDRPTGAQGMIIGFLADNMDMDIFQRDIEAVFHIRRSTATGILKLMEQNGFITRAPVDYDERLKKLSLTREAITKHEKIMVHLTEIETLLVKGLSQSEIDTFYRIIDVMKNNIG